MRVLTHNLLACQARSCLNTSANFPLGLQNIQLEVQEAPLNAAFLRGLVPKLDWPALVYAAQSLGDENLPEQPPLEGALEAEADQVARAQKELHDALVSQAGEDHDDLDDDALWAEAMDATRIPGAPTLKALHHVLMEMQIVEGEMLCANCGHVFRIKNGIPNMVRFAHLLSFPILSLLLRSNKLTLRFHWLVW